MLGIRNYEVTVPPTSNEVGEFVLSAISNHRNLVLTARAERADIGPEENEIEVSLRIKSTRHPDDGSMRILGETEDGDTINLVLPSDPAQPASFSMIFEH